MPESRVPLARARDADQLGAGPRADIEGVGEQFVRRLWDEGLLRSLPDLYASHGRRLMELEGYAEISANNAIAAIEQSKGIPFSRVLFGLNIPQLGWVTAQSVARHFGNVEKLLDATQEDVEAVEGIGPDRAERSSSGSRRTERALVAELRALGINFELSDTTSVRRGAAHRVTRT